MNLEDSTDIRYLGSLRDPRDLGDLRDLRDREAEHLK